MHHRVTREPMTDATEVIRSSVGGYPILPAGEAWPVCTEDECNQRLALFFQFHVGCRPNVTLAVKARERLAQPRRKRVERVRRSAPFPLRGLG
jgi:hypothetical protein